MQKEIWVTVYKGKSIHHLSDTEEGAKVFADWHNMKHQTEGGFTYKNKETPYTVKKALVTIVDW